MAEQWEIDRARPGPTGSEVMEIKCSAQRVYLAERGRFSYEQLLLDRAFQAGYACNPKNRDAILAAEPQAGWGTPCFECGEPVAPVCLKCNPGVAAEPQAAAPGKTAEVQRDHALASWWKSTRNEVRTPALAFDAGYDAGSASRGASITELHTMLREVAQQFEFYARNHALKDTDDGRAKQKVNSDFALKCYNVIAETERG